MKQRLARWRRAVAYRIGLLGAVAVVLAILGLVILVLAYAVSAFRGSALLQVLGAAILGAGLSALVGAVTGREAIHQQSAREANLWRKRETYGPLYAELKAVRTALSDAKEGKAPAPLRIDNSAKEESDEEESEVIMYLALQADILSLKCWPTFRRDYRDTDFTPKAQGWGCPDFVEGRNGQVAAGRCSKAIGER